MHAYRAAFCCLLAAVLALAASPSSAQNPLANPGFDRDLSGWIVTTSGTSPSPDPGVATISWTPTDASGSSLSGGVALHAKSTWYTTTVTASVGQCLPVAPGTLATLSAKFLTTRQRMTAAASVALSAFATADCTGTPLASASAPSLPFAPPETTSGGRWLPTTTRVVASPGTRSVLAELSALAYRTMTYGPSEVEAVADDAVLALTPVSTTAWILPSAAWVHGEAGSYWTTRFTLANPGPDDAVATLKWLGHDADGRGGHEFTYLVRAGETLAPEMTTWELSFAESWGAILVTSTSPALVLQSETSTRLSGGTAGQALPALGPGDFAGATPKTLAPIRQTGAFRTNLVLANPTEDAETALVALYGADGALLGSREVELPPLGMTQVSGVAAALGAPYLALGRLAVSTPTPGGAVAAYASVIDNTTNDPRTLLPR
ncbi:MAG: hypothetical protein U0529_09025 [Thermoanaerobaculia bacterium]